MFNIINRTWLNKRSRAPAYTSHLVTMVTALGPDRFCSGRLDILRQNVAAKSSIFCRAWHKKLDILLHFAPGKRVLYPLPVQSRATFHKNRRVGLSTWVSTHVSLNSSKIKSIHSESQRYFGDMISSWPVYPAERVKNKEIQVSGIDFTQHLDILFRFCRQFPLFQFFDILPKELPAGSVWAYTAQAADN